MLISERKPQCAFGVEFDSDRRYCELNLSPKCIPGKRVALVQGNEILQSTSSEAFDYQYEAGALRFHVPSVANYSVTVNAVSFSPYKDAADVTVRLFLFGSAMGALLHLSGALPLHGSAVRLPGGGASIFCGKSNAGKSSLATALGLQGYPVLADDIAAVRIDSAGIPWVYPGLARSKLWADTIEHLKIKARVREKIRSVGEKYAVAMNIWHQPERLTHIYELEVSDKVGLEMGPVVGLEKIRLLDRQTFRRGLIDVIGDGVAHSLRLGKLAQQLKAHRISRPLNEPTFPDIIKLLEQSWA